MNLNLIQNPFCIKNYILSVENTKFIIYIILDVFIRYGNSNLIKIVNYLYFSIFAI